jgi:hypothetical protein
VYQSKSQPAGLNARIVNIWADGPVDVVVTDPSLRSGTMLVKRIPYVPYGSTPPAADPYDSRYVIQISTGSGLPASGANTAPTEGVANTGPGTEPLEN